MDAHESIETINIARHPERGRCLPTRVAAPQRPEVLSAPA
jgi:hypothetical protein